MTAKPIMVQGTMSGAGKSLLVAGLCRVFAQDGYRVAPFKSQNMALNSAITATGAEMGRAQVVQAEAAGVAPEAAMNPILLKPTTDVGSQVIVNGRVLGTMGAREYFAFKHRLVPDIMRAYDDLASRFDIIVIEGAGSPAEVNLKDDDIVNMGMARMAKSPVLLAGDIDRGGVFAQLLGTLMLLEDDERAMVKGLVVNKFRGDKTILDPGLDILRERSGIPIAGVVPYTLLDIDDEDSMSDRLSVRGTKELVDIAVIRLPKVSNFTDFIALDAIDGVGVRYVSRPSDMGEPDLIILPGTKNTIADLKWLRESGVETVWYKVSYNNQELYANSNYVTTNIEDTNFSAIEPTDQFTLTIKTPDTGVNTVNLRTILTYDKNLPEGHIISVSNVDTQTKPMTVVAKNATGTWYKVKYDNKDYYLAISSGTKPFLVGLPASDSQGGIIGG